MEKRNFLTSLKLLFLAFAMVLFSACIKNDNFIIGDAKVRVFNAIISDTTRNFFFNNALFNSQSGVSALSTSTNTSYFVVEADKEYLIDSRNSISGTTSTSTKNTFDLGKNYSIYYTKKDSLLTTKPELLIFQDLVRQDTTKAQVMFINLGYKLGAKVTIKNRSNTYSATLDYKEKSDYVSISVLKPSSTLLFNLENASGDVDSLSYTNFTKGKVYTVILEGDKNGKLKERVVANN